MSTGRTYSKPAQTPEQLLDKMKRQGLVVAPEDEATALRYLRYVGHYRLKGYWHHLVDPEKKCFPAGLTFEQIARRYELDRELRVLVMAALERLETAIRSVMANHLSLTHGPHWFLKPEIFKSTPRMDHHRLLQKIEEEVGRAKNDFVEHYRATYDDPYLPPSWAVSECVSFGFWSNTYQILLDRKDRKRICEQFKVDEESVFQSWIHALSVLRNIAAHHGRFLRTAFSVAPVDYRKQKITFDDARREHKTFFASATVIHYLLRAFDRHDEWKQDLKKLFSKYPEIDLKRELGFSGDWETRPGWV